MKKYMILAFSLCLLGTMGFALPDTGKPIKMFSGVFALFQRPEIANTNKEIKELPIAINENKTEKTIKIQVGKEVFTGKLQDNATTKALIEKFPITLDMGDLNSNEKYYFMEERLPTNSERVGSIESGDIMLYGSDCLVLFYEDFSTSYSYTKLGELNDVTKLKTALGKGNVKVTWSLEK